MFDFKLSLGSVTSAAAAFTVAAIVVGYAFEVGFILTIDSTLLPLLSVSDYISISASYIFSVPALILAVVVPLALSMFLEADKIQGPMGLWRELFVETKPISRRTKTRLTRFAAIIFPIGGIAASILGQLRDAFVLRDFLIRVGIGIVAQEWIVSALMQIGWVVGLISLTLRAIAAATDRSTRRFSGAMTCVSAIVLVAAICGGTLATTRLESKISNVTIYVQEDGQTSTKSGVLLQALAEGVLYREVGSDRHTYFIPTEKISEIVFGQ